MKNGNYSAHREKTFLTGIKGMKGITAKSGRHCLVLNHIDLYVLSPLSLVSLLNSICFGFFHHAEQLQKMEDPR